MVCTLLYISNDTVLPGAIRPDVWPMDHKKHLSR